MVFFLEELSKRTEFSVLQNLTECVSVSSENLDCSGVLIIPGFAYKKIPDDTKTQINTWLESASNHLLLVPSWTAIDLTKPLDLPVPVTVVKYESFQYDSISVSYGIEAGVKEKFYLQENKVLGVSLRRNTGSGLISVLTIPVLDYKQATHFEKFTKILEELFRKNTVKTSELTDSSDKFVPTNTHFHLLMLYAAGIDVQQNLAEKMQQYFACDLSERDLQAHIQELHSIGLLSEHSLSAGGKQLIEHHKLYAFVKVIKKREERGNEW